MSPEEHKAVVLRLVEAVFNTVDPAAIDELFAPDYVDHDPTNPGGTRASVREQLAAFRAFLPDMRVIVEDLLAEGDRVMARLSVRGTSRGAFLDLPPTGRPVTFETIEVFRLRDGRFTEHWAEADVLGILQQLDGRITPAHGVG